MDLTGFSGNLLEVLKSQFKLDHHQDPYVKIYLLHNGQRVTKKKTHIKKRSLNPVFNESFVFDLPDSAETLSSIQLEFVVLDWDRLTKNEVC